MRALLVSSAWVLAAAVPAEQLTLDLRGDLLMAQARKLDLIQPRLLEQLKRGATVAFDFQLSLWVSDRTAPVNRRAFERFVVSYDLWEERFAVTTLRKPQLRATGLAAGNVAGWCLQNIGLPTPPKLNPADRLFVRLEVRAVENRREIEAADEDALTLSNLIEIFSRGAKSGESRWSLESGPVQFAVLRAREVEKIR